jgi:hypothetical protein
LTPANRQSNSASAPAPSKPRDPVELARTLVEQFSSALESGVRGPLYAFLQGNFLLGSFYKESLDDYRRFQNDEYWRDVPQKPNERNLMRSVLAYTMRTKERGRKKLQNRVYKYARVLEYFYQHEVISDEVPLRLRDGGGIDAIYARVCGDGRPPEGGGVGLEETMAELPRTANGTTAAVQRPFASGEIDGDGDDRLGLADEGQRGSAPEALSAAVQAAGPSKRGQLPRGFQRFVLEVEMFEFELEEVLHAKRATICVKVEPPGNRRWRPVIAQFVFTSNRTDGPWPGRSTIDRDGDERR